MSGKEFDLGEIKTLMSTAVWECEPGGSKSRRVYLGTVQALTPSGKYYTVFSSNGVTQAEMEKDMDWHASTERALAEIGYSLVAGEGDPCDLFAEERVDA